MSFPPVIAGLDPAIHPAKPEKILVLMDARVKPAHDGARGGRFLAIYQRSREIAR
jgi:hypothetical protein